MAGMFAVVGSRDLSVAAAAAATGTNTTKLHLIEVEAQQQQFFVLTTSLTPDQDGQCIASAPLFQNDSVSIVISGVHTFGAFTFAFQVTNPNATDVFTLSDNFGLQLEAFHATTASWETITVNIDSHSLCHSDHAEEFRLVLAYRRFAGSDTAPASLKLSSFDFLPSNASLGIENVSGDLLTNQTLLLEFESYCTSEIALVQLDESEDLPGESICSAINTSEAGRVFSAVSTDPGNEVDEPRGKVERESTVVVDVEGTYAVCYQSAKDSAFRLADHVVIPILTPVGFQRALDSNVVWSSGGNSFQVTSLVEAYKGEHAVLVSSLDTGATSHLQARIAGLGIATFYYKGSSVLEVHYASNVRLLPASDAWQRQTVTSCSSAGTIISLEPNTTESTGTSNVAWIDHAEVMIGAEHAQPKQVNISGNLVTGEPLAVQFTYACFVEIKLVRFTSIVSSEQMKNLQLPENVCNSPADVANIEYHVNYGPATSSASEFNDDLVQTGAVEVNEQGIYAVCYRRTIDSDSPFQLLAEKAIGVLSETNFGWALDSANITWEQEGFVYFLFSLSKSLRVVYTSHNALDFTS